MRVRGGNSCLMGMNDQGSDSLQTRNNKGQTLVSLDTNIAGEGTVLTINGMGDKTASLP